MHTLCCPQGFCLSLDDHDVEDEDDDDDVRNDADDKFSLQMNLLHTLFQLSINRDRWIEFCTAWLEKWIIQSRHFKVGVRHTR